MAHAVGIVLAQVSVGVEQLQTSNLIEHDLVKGAQHEGELRSHAVAGFAAGGVIGVRFEADLGLLLWSHPLPPFGRRS